MSLEHQDKLNTSSEYDPSLHETLIEAVDDMLYKVGKWIDSGEHDSEALTLYSDVLEDHVQVHAKTYKPEDLSAKYLPQPSEKH